MNSKPNAPDRQQVDDKPPGYQPTLGRKLVMLGLCVAGLIIVWVFYFLDR